MEKARFFDHVQTPKADAMRYRSSSSHGRVLYNTIDKRVINSGSSVHRYLEVSILINPLFLTIDLD